MSFFSEFIVQGIRPVYVVDRLTEQVPRAWPRQMTVRATGILGRVAWKKAFWTAGAFGYYHTTDQTQSKWVPALASMPYLGYNLSRDVANKLKEN
jgi:hypothetical protein